MKRLGSIWFCLFFLVTVDAQHGRGLEEEQGCEDGEEQTSVEEYVLVDLLGLPGQIEDDDIRRLEASFVTAYGKLSLCNYTLEGFIIKDGIDGYGNDDASSVVTTFTERAFSYMLTVRAKRCPRVECEETTSLFTKDQRRTKDNRALEKSKQRFGLNSKEYKLRATRGVEEINSTSCTCEAVSEAIFFGQWQHDYESSEGISQIVDMSSVELDEDCDAAQFSKYVTQTFVTLETAASLNNEQLEQLAQLFLES